MYAFVFKAAFLDIHVLEKNQALCIFRRHNSFCRICSLNIHCVGPLTEAGVWW